MNANTIVDELPNGYRWANERETESWLSHFSRMVQVRRPEHGEDATDLAIIE